MANYIRQGSIDDENFRYLADSSTESTKSMSDDMNTDFVNLQTGFVNAIKDFSNELDTELKNVSSELENIDKNITNVSGNTYTIYEVLNTFFNGFMPYLESIDESLQKIAEKMEV